jgi:hypothetical protein
MRLDIELSQFMLLEADELLDWISDMVRAWRRLLEMGWRRWRTKR